MDDDRHLSRIVTLWSIVRQAHGDSPEDARSAQEQLLQRYGGAVRRYLLASLRNEDAADEVFQEFALRFVRGDFQSADPELGRFRSFLKTVVFRLVVDHQRRRGRAAKQGNVPVEEIGDRNTPAAFSDEQFEKNWRDELLARTWSRLQEVEQSSRKPYYMVLRLRVDYPDLSSTELAERLSLEAGKPITAGNVRVLVHRSRQEFAELLLDEVGQSLPSADPDALEEELIALNLHDYCREVLQKRREDEGGLPGGGDRG